MLQIWTGKRILQEWVFVSCLMCSVLGFNLAVPRWKYRNAVHGFVCCMMWEMAAKGVCVHDSAGANVSSFFKMRIFNNWNWMDLSITLSVSVQTSLK